MEEHEIPDSEVLSDIQATQRPFSRESLTQSEELESFLPLSLARARQLSVSLMERKCVSQVIKRWR